MNRLFQTASAGTLGEVSRWGRLGFLGSLRLRGDWAACSEALMPVGYNPDLPRKYQIRPLPNSYNGTGGFEIRVTPDPDFESNIKSVQKFIRTGVVSYLTAAGFQKWLDRDLRQTLPTGDDGWVAAEAAQCQNQEEAASAPVAAKQAELDKRFDAVMAQALANKPEAENGLTRWYVKAGAGHWTEVSSFDVSQEKLAEWLSQSTGVIQSFSRARLEPRAGTALVCEMGEGRIERYVFPFRLNEREVAEYQGKIGANQVRLETVWLMPSEADLKMAQERAERYSGLWAYGGQRNQYRGYDNGYRYNQNGTGYSQNRDWARIRPARAAMRITRAAFDEVVATIGTRRAETGGILGGSYADGVITKFHFDSEAMVSGGAYHPSTEEVNRTLREEWNPAGVRLLGMIHSHPYGHKTPTASYSDDPQSSDFAFAKNILRMIDRKRSEDPVDQQGPKLERLLLPIVFSGGDGPCFQLYAYAVVGEGQEYVMEEMTVEIIEADGTAVAYANAEPGLVPANPASGETGIDDEEDEDEEICAFCQKFIEDKASQTVERLSGELYCLSCDAENPECLVCGEAMEVSEVVRNPVAEEETYCPECAQAEGIQATVLVGKVQSAVNVSVEA